MLQIWSAGIIKWQKDNNISTLYTDLYTRINIFCNVDMEASDIIPFFVIFLCKYSHIKLNLFKYYFFHVFNVYFNITCQMNSIVPGIQISQRRVKQVFVKG